MPRSNAYYGWVPDLPDARDYTFHPRLFGADDRIVIPDAVDLRPQCPPVYDQSSLGSCTANAIGSAVEYDLKRQGLEDFRPSRLFIYYLERKIEGSVSEDSGAMIRDGIKVIAKYGSPHEDIWPYQIEKFAQRPTRTTFRDARQHKAVTYARVAQSQMDFQRCLAIGFPFVFGFSVYESFESDRTARTGVVSLPRADEAMVGGHAVKAVGYEQIDGALWIWVKNSWGTDWGVKGYFRMPVGYLLDPSLADDFWIVSVVS